MPVACGVDAGKTIFCCLDVRTTWGCDRLVLPYDTGRQNTEECNCQFLELGTILRITVHLGSIVNSKFLLA
eukprot:3986561-Amphidinium_carterae.1